MKRMISAKNAKGFQRVEISEEVLKLGEEDSANDESKEKHESVVDEEDSTVHSHTKSKFPKSTKRNAMGEYLPGNGEKPLTQQAFSGPGPSSYAPVVNLTKPSPPNYSIVGKPKEITDDYVPGSDQYDTSENMIWNRKTRTLKAKLMTSPYRPKPRDHLTCSLGSAAYKVEYYDTGKHAPQYTIGSRFEEPIIFGPPNAAVEPVDTMGFTAPGPNYSPYGERGMEKSFGVKYSEIRPKDTPGPAEYTLPNANRGPQYSLGHKVKDPSGFDVPGPGAYEMKTAIGTGVATSIRGRQPVPLKYSVPSPNTYCLPDTFQDAPKHSMTYRAFETEVCETPGPANYSQSSRKLWKTPAEYSCRKQCRPSFPEILNYPEYGLMKNGDVGPDTYDADKGFDKNNSPAYSIGKRRPDLTNKNPGPAHYEIPLTCRPDSFKAPEFSMGKAGQKEKASTGPGPAAYHPRSKKIGPAYSMSSRSKQKKVNPTPAPNAYQVCKGQTCKGINNGCSATLKSRASPYVYSGFPNLARVTT